MSETKTAPNPIRSGLLKPNRKLLETQFNSAEFVRRDMIATPEAGTTLDEMLEPAYWSNVARFGTPGALKQWDRIEVRPADGAWWAELIVLTVQPFAVKVATLRSKHFSKLTPEEEAAEIPAGYEVKSRGAAHGWSVTRQSDRVVLHEKARSRDDALGWLHAHLRSLGQRTVA